MCNRNRWAFREKEEEGLWSHSLGVTQTLVGRDCRVATSRSTLTPKSVSFMASGLEKSCQRWRLVSWSSEFCTHPH